MLSYMKEQELLDHVYGRLLPRVYRSVDAKINSPLYRYMQANFVGGGKGALEDINTFLQMVDPEKVPEKWLPFFLGSYGIPWMDDIAPKYHRMVLNNIGEVIKRRGTYAGVRHLISLITSMPVVLRYERGTVIDPGTALELQGRFLWVDLQVATIDEFLYLALARKVIQDYIELLEVPYYITCLLVSTAVPIEIYGYKYLGFAMAMGIEYNINSVTYDFNGNRELVKTFYDVAMMVSVVSTRIFPQGYKFTYDTNK